MRTFANHPPSKHRALRIAGHVLLACVLGLALAGAFGAAVQFLWNHLMPALFPVPAITYAQAVGLLVLARLLFGRFGGSGRHRRWLRRHHPHATGEASCNCWLKPGCGCTPDPTRPEAQP